MGRARDSRQPTVPRPQIYNKVCSESDMSTLSLPPHLKATLALPDSKTCPTYVNTPPY
ncbi:hypothetical protein AG1IA_05442 [Rhizoctonia solani AG-1 IA]|uniref:Uncharacterized protein n=1 Tax=Thanatephorus cucumeris (strain AG1-IA) TaxID=983506 RepID=L8WR89_THACA|nr:hypothetical protein AG1IA_05442 [Rhizoctonia solani AG-1 IA]